MVVLHWAGQIQRMSLFCLMFVCLLDCLLDILVIWNGCTDVDDDDGESVARIHAVHCGTFCLSFFICLLVCLLVCFKTSYGLECLHR